MDSKVNFFCYECSANYKLAEQVFGKTTICPKCQSKILVPNFDFNKKYKLENGITLKLHHDGTFSIQLVPPRKKQQRAKDGSGHFRCASWGMNRFEVHDTETSEFLEENENGLVYQGTVGEYNSLIAYVFVDDKFVKGRYIITEEYSNSNQYIEEYVHLKELLIDIYDTPLSDEVLWLDEMFKDDPQNYGTAIGLGQLRLVAEWETNESDIGLILTGNNSECSLSIEYQSKELSALLEQKRKASYTSVL